MTNPGIGIVSPETFLLQWNLYKSLFINLGFREVTTEFVEYFIEKHIDKPWHWGEYGLSQNPSVTMEFVQNTLTNLRIGDTMDCLQIFL